MVLWCLWGKRNAIWLKMQICERSSNSLICWINQQKATSFKESATSMEWKDSACIAFGIHSWKSIKSHSHFLFEKLQMVSWTVALQALSQRSVSLVPKGSLPILSVCCCCSYLQLQRPLFLTSDHLVSLPLCSKLCSTLGPSKAPFNSLI